VHVFWWLLPVGRIGHFRLLAFSIGAAAVMFPGLARLIHEGRFGRVASVA
jgi:hypothetical protein